MRYYIKIFNQNTHELVGYYKETGRNCISKLINGIKYFDDKNTALSVCNDLDRGFLRDKDKHYYTAFACVYGDNTKQPPKEVYKSRAEKEGELENELSTFIRKNSSKTRR